MRLVSANIAFQCVMLSADIWLTDNTPQSYRTCRSTDTVIHRRALYIDWFMPALWLRCAQLIASAYGTTALDVVNCTWNFHLCAHLRAAFSKPLLSGTCTHSHYCCRCFFGFYCLSPVYRCCGWVRLITVKRFTSWRYIRDHGVLWCLLITFLAHFTICLAVFRSRKYALS